ncbi:MAG: DNA/RNA non-specific endonuclease [Oscillospiraceae bacterium]|nr:DNA/RNA non-specific endonuclease [Oscillospiraceae bacterium]
MIRNRIISIISAALVLLSLVAVLVFRTLPPADTEPDIPDGPEIVIPEGPEDPDGPDDPGGPEDPAEPQTVIPESAGAAEGNGSGPAPQAPELTWLEGLDIPEYSGKAYIPLNGNVPFFDTDSIAPVSYEIYYELDSLGRCTLADAVVGQDIMADGKRGSISEIKPTGWHTERYSFVDGEALYNRCHLIAHYLTGENANPRNLVTGTRYMNTAGMNALENMVGDYIKETGNHVRYRVTPVWTGDNLICDGLLVEAWSVEDGGEDVCFCIYAYNVQPGIVIDYLTGDNYAVDGEKPKDQNSEPSYAKYLLEEDVTGTYILNTKKKKFHRPDCQGVKDIAPENKEEYTGSRNELVEEGYVPCGGCNP